MEAIPNNKQRKSALTIAFLRRGYSATGGAEAYLMRLATGLHDQGYRVVLLGTGHWPAQVWPGGEVVVLPHQSLREFAAAGLAFKKEGKIDLLFSFERVPGCDIFRAGDGVHAAWLQHKSKTLLSKFTAAAKSFVVPVLAPSSASCALSCSAPSVPCSSSAPAILKIGSMLPSWWRRLFLKGRGRHQEVLQLERELFSNMSTTRVIANSNMVAQEIRAYFQFPESQITVIPNGVPSVDRMTLQERSALRDALGIAGNECIILFIGSGWERKGLSVAIKAFRKAHAVVPSLRLWVAGKGSAKKYRIPFVRFLGSVKNVSQLYAAADLFILPTLYDPFSNASLEALAAGLPVVTSAMNGCSEIIISEVHGTVVQDPMDVDGFSSALLRWQERLQQPKAATATHDICAKRGAEFGIEKNVEATLAVMEQVLKEQSEQLL